MGAEIFGRGWSDSDSEKAMYEGLKTRVIVNGRKVSSVRVGVHQDSFLSPIALLLVVFFIVLEGLSIEKSDKACSQSYLMLMIMFCSRKDFAARKIQQMEVGHWKEGP